MNRVQFWILNGLGIVLVVLFGLHIFLSNLAVSGQNRMVSVQRFLQEGQYCDTRVRQLATRIYQVSQQTQDQALKDLLTRQDIRIAPPQQQAQPGAEQPAPDTSTPTPTR
jgi:hypothetical protein